MEKHTSIEKIRQKMCRPGLGPISRQAFYVRMGELGIRPYKAITEGRLRACLRPGDEALLLKRFRKDYSDAER